MRRLAILSLLAGCSTLAQEPAQQECVSDGDCQPGFACNPNASICVSTAGAPPLRNLGFDLSEIAAGQTQFRVEIGGCDKQVRGQAMQNRLEIARADVSETIELDVFVVEPVDPDNPTLEEVLAADFELAGASRFDRDPPITRSTQYPTLSPGGTVVTTRVGWPRYDPDSDIPASLGPEGYLVWTVRPTDDVATFYQMLVPPQLLPDQPCTNDSECGPELVEACSETYGLCRQPLNFRYRSIYPDACDRGLKGDIVRIDGDDLEAGLSILGPIAANVTIRHQDSDGERLIAYKLDEVPVAERPSECTIDAQCLEGQICDQGTRQCALALAGRSTGKSAASSTDGEFQTRVFTYCEGLGNVPLVRDFAFTVTPDPMLTPRALPSLNFAQDVTFTPVQDAGKPDGDLGERRLCIPDWGEAREIQLTVRGDPVRVVDDDSLNLQCCDVGCLPATAEALEAGLMSAPQSCRGPTSSGALPTVRAEAPVVLTQAELDVFAAEGSGCATPLAAADGKTVGALRRTGECSTSSAVPQNPEDPEPGTCTIARVAAGPDGAARPYTLRVESPVGSLLASIDTTVEVTATGAELDLKLRPRELVRGFVRLPASVCQTENEGDGDCGSDGAVVLAERLRRPDETVANVPGPYFHEVNVGVHPTTGQQGFYVLPLDPGVWVITALPAAGTRGGPARMEALEIAENRGVVELDFELDPGIFVQLDVSSFDRRSQVVPLDTGSWILRAVNHPLRTNDLDPARQFLDLNDPEECLGATPEGGSASACRIRRLVVGSSLPLTQVGQVRFTARDAGPGARDCTIAGVR